MKNRKLLIFDLDGTLLNSLAGISESCNELLKQLNLPVYQEHKYVDFIGLGLKNLLQKALGENYPISDEDKLISEYKEIYSKKWEKFSFLYDGVGALLESLTKKGHLIALLSNKSHEAVIEIKDELFSDYDFKIVRGIKKDSEIKPNPALLLEIIKSLGVAKENCYYVGDSLVDIETAKNASIKSISVLWGYGCREDIEKNSLKVNHPLEILDIIDE